VFSSLHYEFDDRDDLSWLSEVDATYTDTAPWRFPPITNTNRKLSLTTGRSAARLRGISVPALTSREITVKLQCRS